MPEQPDENAAIISFGYEAGQLKKLPRAGWLLTGIASPESVADHSFRVAVLAYAIAVQEGANPEHAAALGLFHDFPEARIGDVPSVGRPYVRTADPAKVIADQAAALPPILAGHITGLIAEHESAKTPGATLESRCSRDADKLECLMQAREYQTQGNQLVQPWIDSMIAAVTTRTGMALAKTAQDLSPSIWWDEFAASYGTRKPMTD
jgi:putative hydrolases of HD superfamily